MRSGSIRVLVGICGLGGFGWGLGAFGFASVLKAWSLKDFRGTLNPRDPETPKSLEITEYYLKGGEHSRDALGAGRILMGFRV